MRAVFSCLVVAPDDTIITYNESNGLQTEWPVVRLDPRDYSQKDVEIKVQKNKSLCYMRKIFDTMADDH